MNAFSAEEMSNEIYALSDPETILLLSPCNSLSNLGSFDFGKERNYKNDVTQCLFTAVIGKSAATFNHVITTVNNKLSWVISSSRSRVDEDKAHLFANLCFNTSNEVSKKS